MCLPPVLVRQDLGQSTEFERFASTCLTRLIGGAAGEACIFEINGLSRHASNNTRRNCFAPSAAVIKRSSATAELVLGRCKNSSTCSNLETRWRMERQRSCALISKTVVVAQKLESILTARPKTNWEPRIHDSKFAERACEDVEKILNAIHMARPKPKEPLFMLGEGSGRAVPLVEES